MIKKKLLLFILCFVFFEVTGQQFSISGWVMDSASGEHIIGANVMLIGQNAGTTTDNYGHFQLKISNLQFPAKIRVTYLGYNNNVLLLEQAPSKSIKIYLSPLVLREVEIKAEKEPVQERVGVINIPVEKLKSRPMLLGEADIMKALALTPGVKTGTEGSAGLYIRGGTPDQNYILLDGATVYNTSHLFGFLSVFNPDAIKSVTLYKGNIPARYGGRLSSVIDVSMKEGNNQKHEQDLSLGVISSKVLLQGPIKKNKSSYLFSGRSSYLGLFGLPSRISFNKKKSDDYFNYWMYDLNGKANFDLTENSRLYFSFYSGRDYWKALSRATSERYDFGINWGNTTFSTRYTNLLKNKVFFVSQMSYNQYRYSVEQLFFDESDAADKDYYFNRSFVKEFSWRNSAKFSPMAYFNVEAGAELVAQQLSPQGVKFSGGNVIIDSIPIIPSKKYMGLSTAVFVENNLTLLKSMTLSAGLRGVTFNTGGNLYKYLEPRTSLTYKHRSGAVSQVSWRQNRQFTHLLATSSVGLPNEVWVPATATTPPSKAYQWSVGISQPIKRAGLVLSLESYYKEMSQLLDYRQGINIIGSGKDWEQLVEKKGNGRSYGFEAMLQKQEGRLNGWISYTWSKNERKFGNINNGMWYPHRYDRRHDLAVTGNYQFNKKWTCAANFVFSTGEAITAPSYFYVLNNTYVQPFYTGKNTERTPNYHRLDISLTKNFTTKNNRTAYLNFGVYNAYAHTNPFYVNIDAVYQNDPNNFFKFTGFNVKYEVKSIFTFIPSVSYGIKF